QWIDRQKEFVGMLKSYDQNTITIEIEGEEKVLEKSQIALVRLAFDF
ncbi:ribosome maturation factor RimP, partial [bacterium 1XD42-8]